MVTPELIEAIKEKYQEGANRQRIIDELGELGWQETDVDAAIRQIQHEALQKLPIIFHVNQFIAQLDAKTSKLSLPVVLGICGGMALAVVIIALFLYNTLDPLGSKTAARDNQRESAMNTLHNAIDAFYKKNARYPAVLSDLVPVFLPALPTDPRTGQPYEYTVRDNDENYQLCVQFETLSVQCVSSATDSTIPYATQMEMPPSQPPVSVTPVTAITPRIQY